jgi:hypothetical protein
MLQWSPKARASASDLLDDPWLRVGQLDDNTHMSRQYYKEWMKASNLEAERDSSSDTDSNSGSDGSVESDAESSDKSSQLSIEGDSNLSDLHLVPSKHDSKQSSKGSEGGKDVAPEVELDEEVNEDISLMQTVPDATGLNF